MVSLIEFARRPRIELVVAVVGLVTVVIELEERFKGSSGARQPGASLGRTIRTELRHVQT